MDDELRKLDEIRRRTGVSLAEAKAALDQEAGDLVRALVKLEAAHPHENRPAGGSGASGAVDLGDGRLAACIAHGGGFIGLPVLAPLVLYFLSGHHPFVRHHAIQALMWHLAAAVTSLALLITVIGAVLIPVVILVGLIFTVIAILRAWQGEDYRYPFVGGMADRF